MWLVEDLGVRLLRGREPHQVVIGHAAETAVADRSIVLHLADDQHPLARLLTIDLLGGAPARAVIFADAAFGEKRDAGARTLQQCRIRLEVIGLQQHFEVGGMPAIEIKPPAVERQGKGRRAAGAWPDRAKETVLYEGDGNVPRFCQCIKWLRQLRAPGEKFGVLLGQDPRLPDALELALAEIHGEEVEVPVRKISFERLSLPSDDLDGKGRHRLRCGSGGNNGEVFPLSLR
jgi:hypothetical protein